MFKLGALVAALLGLAMPASAAKPGGVYAIVDASAPAQDAVTAAALATPGVDGLLIHLRWNDISPSRTTYDWASLDRVLKLVTASNPVKRFEIGIVTGAAQPSWITDPVSSGGLGAAHATFDIAAAGKCTTFTMAAPWDHAYLTAFRDLLHQLAQHLRSKQVYGRLSMLKLDGLTTTTDELRLPAVQSCSGAAADPVKTWHTLGYKPDLVEGAWKAMLRSFLDHFPDKAFNIGFIGVNAFPGIDADGSIAPTSDAKTISARFTAKLIADAGAAMPGRLALGFDSLTLNIPPSDRSYGQSIAEYFSDIAAAGARPGWQVNELLGNYPAGGASCGGNTQTNAVPCKGPDEFRLMLFRGVYPNGKANTPPAQQGVYMEVFPQNVCVTLATCTDLRSVHRHLAPWNG
jgi:hypothetical protein